MENLALFPLPPGVQIFIYADVVVIIGKGPAKLARAQWAINQLLEKCNLLGLKINICKSKCMAIKGKPPKTNITLNNTPLEWVTKFTYLGVIIDHHLTFTHSVAYLRGRASARMAP